MSGLVVFVFILGAALAGPPVSRSRNEIEAFRSYLEQGRTENGVRLESRMTVNPKAKAWENSGKFQGDILLDDEQLEGMVNDFALGRNAYTWPNTKWPGDVIVWEFGLNEFNAQQQAAIWASIADIERNTCLKFRYRTASDTSYVSLTGSPDGCYAHVGYWASRGVHIMNLARSNPGTGCFIHTTIIHEWIHIIGFLHMQSTYNRDDYVRIMWENIWPGMEYNFDKYTSDLVSNLGLQYDYASCMHYDAYGFSINGQPSIVALYDFDGVMGQQDYVTPMDWLRINRHYNCPGAWSIRNTNETPIVPVVNDAPIVVNDLPLDNA